MSDRPERAAMKYKALTEPADAGEWTLPDDVSRARAVHARLLAAVTTHPAAPPDPRPSLVAAALTTDDPGSLDVGALTDHKRVTTERAHRLDVLREALNRAADDLTNSVTDHAEDIITGHLAPAGDRLWTEIVKTVTALEDIDLTDTAGLLSAPEKVRKAYLSLDALTIRYGQIRDAWSRVPVEPVQHDDRGDHSEFRAGLCKVWPGHKRMATAPAAAPPWPTGDGGKGRLVWLVRAGAVPWWPTPQQRDSAWMDAHGEDFRRMQEQNQRGALVQQWGR